MTRQIAGSLLVALALVAVTIVVVTAKLGTNTGQRDGGHGGKGGSEQREDR